MRHPQHWYFPQFRYNMRKISAKRYQRAKLLGQVDQMFTVLCYDGTSFSEIFNPFIMFNYDSTTCNDFMIFMGNEKS